MTRLRSIPRQALTALAALLLSGASAAHADDLRTASAQHRAPFGSSTAGRTPNEFIVAAGACDDAETGALTYTVEVEAEAGYDADEIGAFVDATLRDPRSWSHSRPLARTCSAARARIRILLATPATVDALCARAGLHTAGTLSCYNGRVVALNAWRWENGARGFATLPEYRAYLVNHEVGHALGYAHRPCAAEGRIAPVMLQQSKRLDGCTANPWPYP